MDLTENPFFILEAKPHDSAETLLALSQRANSPEKKAACQALLDPASRLGAELGWFLNLAPEKASKILVQLDKPPYMPAFALSNLPFCNVLASSLPHLQETAAITNHLALISQAFGAIKLANLMLEINAARQASHFPVIQNKEQVHKALGVRRKWFLKVMLETLDRLESARLPVCLAEACQKCIANRSNSANSLIDEIVDYYSLRSIPFQRLEEKNIFEAIDRIYEARKRQPENIAALLEILKDVCKNRAKVLLPVTVKAQSRSLVFAANARLATRLRNLAMGLPEIRQEILAIISNFLPACDPT